MKSRLTKFLVLFVLIVTALDIFVDVNGSYFYALSDKLLLKTAILERAPDTKVLFLGSSRFVDGIEQKKFTDELEVVTGLKYKSLNGATTGSQGERTAYFANIAVTNKNLTHVILEASSPAQKDGELGFAEGPATAQPFEEDSDERFAIKFENRLQSWLTGNVALVRYRKALRLKTILQLPVLYLAGSIDPNIWSRKGVVRNLFTSADAGITEEIISKFKPEIIRSDNNTIDPKPISSSEQYDNLVRLSDIFAESGIEVIWVAPPVSAKKMSSNYGPKKTRMYQAVACRYDTVFYDYAGLGADQNLLRDTTHLNSKGRRVFSIALARQLAEHFTALPE
jgi:hypothetical protein